MGLLHLSIPGRKSLKEVIERDWDSIEGAFSSSVRRKGEEYFSSGKVIPTDVSERMAFFRSSGQFANSYSVTLSYDQDTLLGLCTCPSDPPCKHIYASLLILKRKGGPEAKDILMRLHREEMAEILLDYLPDRVKKSLMEGPQKTLAEFERSGDASGLTGLLPFVPVIYDPFEAEVFLERVIDALRERELPCPHTVAMALRGIVRRAPDKVRQLLRIYEMLTSRECNLPLNFGDLLAEDERIRAQEEGVPYDLVRVDGETPPEHLSFYNAEACLDYLLNTPLTGEEAKELAGGCIDRFGLFPPLVLFYLQVGGDPNIALKLLSKRPKASMLSALKGLVPEETFSQLKVLLKSLAPEEYASYVAETSPKDLLELKGMVDEEVLTRLLLKSAERIGPKAVPLIKGEVIRIASGRRWSLYPKLVDLLKVMRRISRPDYKRTLNYLKENFPTKRRLMEMLEELGD